MLFRWLRKRRRRRLWAQPFPPAWRDILAHNVRLYALLSHEGRAKVRNDLRVFVAEKNWEGCGGLSLDDEIKVTIAGQIAIMVRGFPGQYFDHVPTILVYPGAYVAPDQAVTQGGVVVEEDSAREGEAWYRGPVILSWDDVLAGGRGKNDGHNLVFHEFAHQLDMLNGHVVDGIPPLDSLAQQHRWTEVVTKHYQQLVDDCRHGHDTLLDCYGATSMGELFAVATEVFFQRPRALRQRHAELYKVLRQYYRQDPAPPHPAA